MNTITKIEDYVKSLTVQSGHGFGHIDRVRRWIRVITTKEGFRDIELAEAAALLHDIGLSQEGDRRNHGEVSAGMAREFLTQNHLFDKDKIDDLCLAIKFHNKKAKGKIQLCWLLKDADILDLLGPIGIIRACLAYPGMPEFDLKNIKSLAWKADNNFFDPRFKAGDKIANSIVELINFQASCYENMTHKSAKEIAKPLIKEMYDFILDLEKQTKPIINNK